MKRKVACIITAMLLMTGCSTDSKQTSGTPAYSDYLASITWYNIRGLTPEGYGVQDDERTLEILEEAGRKAAEERYADEALQESVASIFPKNGVRTNEEITQYSEALGRILKERGYFGDYAMAPMDASHYANNIWCVRYYPAEDTGEHVELVLTVHFHAIDGHIIRIQ